MARMQQLSVSLTPEQIDWLDGQDEDNSVIVRAAVDEYRDS